MRGRISWGVIWGAVAALGCEGPARKDKDPLPAPISPAAEEEQSPNARILPEPLESGVPERDDDPPIAPEAEERRTKPRDKPRPFPFGKALPADTLRRGTGPGFEMQMEISWPESRKSVTVGDQEKQTWPSLRVQLLRETQKRPARLRMILDSLAFPFPVGTELRGRADRIGHAVLWPNQRSYRIAPPGSLHSLFADRRVDRVPYVELQSRQEGKGSRLGKETELQTLVTPIGTVRMESVVVKELPYASQLLCNALLEVVRLKSSAETCPASQLPVHFEVKWPNEEEFLVTVLSWGAVANLNLDEFRLPPDLPIHKRGELPPFDDFFLDEKSRSQLLPLTKEKKPPLPPQPPEPVEGAPPGQPPEPADEPPGPPRNQILLKNALNRPLVVLLNKVPFVWLAPGDRLPVYLSSSEVRVAARDFLGETVFSERALSAPAQLHFGEASDPATPEAAPAP